MKKLIVLTIFFALSHFCLAQNKVLKVEYSYYFQNYFPEEMSFSLIADEDECISTRNRSIMLRKSGDVLPKKTTTYQHYYRTRDSIYYLELEDQKEYLIIEALNQFEWTFTGNTKTILNYKCQEAMSRFRGRNFIAFFTTELPFKAAPWKFHGLPGTILSVATDDGTIEIEAIELQITSKEYDLENPAKIVRNRLSWEDFAKMKQENWNNFKNRVVSQNSSLGGGATGGSLEVYPELRLDIIIEE